ncbi:hypothetical protein GCM10009872_44250 [Actinopolymorpha rutila]
MDQSDAGDEWDERHKQRVRWMTYARPSPGGWTPPAGVRPGWNWTPPDGVEPHLERVPRWVRIWFWTPWLDRYAHEWLWHHGGFDVLPPDAPAQP